MFNAIVTHFSRMGLAFQLFVLAWPRLPRINTEPRRVFGNYFGIFSLFRELCLTWISITRPGVEVLSTSNPPQIQSPSCGFTSLRHQTRQKMVEICKFQCKITLDHDWCIFYTKIKLGDHFKSPKIIGGRLWSETLKTVK